GGLGALARPPECVGKYPRPTMDLSVFFAGTAGSVPTARRGLPAVLVRRGGERWLFDCGEGTQRQLIRTVGLPDVECVFLTHLHADHWLGLPGMLKSFELRDRDAQLDVYGPSGTQQMLDSMRRVIGRTRYPIRLTELRARPEAELLIHEATFLGDEAERALQTGHSTARQAAELARDAEVKLLALTHVSTRYAGFEVRDEARAIFERTELPRDFDTIE